MVMTEEDKKEFISKYVTSDCIFESKEGTLLFTHQASKNIAEQFKIFLEDGGVFSVEETIYRMIEIEDKRRAARLSISNIKEKDSSKQISDVIKKFNPTDVYSIARAIVEEFPDLSVVQRTEELLQAEKNGLINSRLELEIAIIKTINNNSLYKRISDIIKETENETELVDKLTRSLLTFYNAKAINYGMLLTTLEKNGLDEDIIDVCMQKVRDGIQLDIIRRYTNTKLSTEEIAKDIDARYGNLNFRFISDSLSKINNPNLDIERLTYELYCREDESFVKTVLLIPGLDIQERVNRLIELEIEYPVWCIKETFLTMRRSKLFLPYEKLFNLYVEHLGLGNKSSQGVVFEVENRDGEMETYEIDFNQPMAVDINGPVAEEEVLEAPDVIKEEVGLVPISNRNIVRLTDEEDSLELDDEPVRKSKFKILGRKKETSPYEKKKTLLAVATAAGCLATTLLTVVYLTDMTTAASNSFTAMEPLLSKIGRMVDSIPTPAQFISIMTSVGTTILATIKYFKHNKKNSKIVNNNLVPLEKSEFSVEVLEPVEAERLNLNDSEKRRR